MTETCKSLPIKALILSDNHITRSGLRRILESYAGFQVLGEGSVGSTNIVESLVRQHPEVILLDLDPNGIDALGFLRNLEKLTRSSAVIILSDLGNDELVRKALALGAAGIVLKLQPPSALIAIIQSLNSSAKQAFEENGSGNHAVAVTGLETVGRASKKSGKIDSLTTREREIIRLIAAGLKNKEVASRLRISDITVRHHLTSIFSKLDVSNRQKLLILAHEHGLVELTLSQNA